MSKEFEKAMGLTVSGDLKEQALAAFEKQIKAWGLAMPKVEPLVLDFGLGDFYKIGLIECWIANEIEAGYCGKYLFLFDGQRCPAHRHEQKHETFCVVKGDMTLTVDGRDHKLAIGDVQAVPPGYLHTFVGDGNALILEISMPCVVADNQFENPTIQRYFRR